VLQAAWAPNKAPVGDLIRMALVVCADHELNVSTFAARCTASAGASPYDAVSAAMATLRGRRHGGATERVAALFAETEKPSRARAVMANRLRLGESLPGFGHPLYLAGDPRASLLLRLAEASGNEPSGSWFVASRGRDPSCCMTSRIWISGWWRWRGRTACPRALR
jgi:citrate synthase